MPKKTKRAKLIAEYRKKLQLLGGTHATEVALPVQKESTTPSLYELPKTISQKSVTSVTMSLPENEFKSIQSDLLKTIVVVALFFGLEIVLWRVFG